MGIVVDTSEFIAVEREQASALEAIAGYDPLETYAISAMTLAELQHGVARADTLIRRRLRQAFLAEVMYTFAIYPMDADIALRVGSLDADMQAAGQKIGLPDIVIAATALHLGFSVATRNARDFQRVPGLRIAESITPR